jgi:PRTRC genetic system protein B
METDMVPRVTLTLTDETIWLTRHDRCGAAAATYPVSMVEVSNAFNRFGARTGLLPADALFWSSIAGSLRLGIWLNPAIRALRIGRGKKVETLRVPLPGLVFVGQGKQYSIYAAQKRPMTDRAQLYQAPLPNVHQNGSICAGNVQFPAASGETIGQAVEMFFESLFNYDLADGKLRNDANLITFLRGLRKARAFPIDRLAPSPVTLREVMGMASTNGERTNGYHDPVGDENDNEIRFDEDVWGNEIDEEDEEI